MTTQEAAEVIETIVKSLKENAAQFQIEVKVSITGASGTAHGGGIGMLGISHGGGIGISSSVNIDDAKISLANQKGTAVMNEQRQALINHLSAMAEELRSKSPERSKLVTMYELLKGTWVPGVISSVIGNLITRSFMG
jgi:hypothetical protein